MISELNEHLAQLSSDLNKRIRFELSISADCITDSWPELRNQFQLYADGYKMLYRVTLKQIMQVKAADFVLKED